MDVIERARALRKQIEINASTMDEETALEYAELFPAWNAGQSYIAGERVRKDGVLYTVLQDHTAQSDWTPEDAVSLFAEVLPGQACADDIGLWVQPDSTNPYNTGNKVVFEGKTYESLIDNNVWSPSAYPAGWKEV